MLGATTRERLMLHVFGFDRVGVAVGDLYFLDPHPGPGQEGAERGVRLEVRLLERPPVDASIYASRPILVDKPVWRADLLETVAGGPGTWDRAHHHPRMRGWEPNSRKFEDEMCADPLGFVAAQLRDLEGLVRGAGMNPSEVTERDVLELRSAVPEIVDTVRTLLADVRDGRLAQGPAGDDELESARAGWL
jgi:hypothetical protein